MPCMIRLLTPTDLIAVPTSAASLAEAADLEPHDGVYTVANTFEATKVLKLDAHLDRLERSAGRAGIPLELDRPRLRAALRQMILDAGYGDVRYRVTAPKETPDRLILTIEPFKPVDAAIYASGVRVVTLKGSARHDPAAKTTGWMHDRKAIEAALPAGIYTGLLLSSEGDLLEGVSSNFYAVLDEVLRTAGEGMLPGIAQQIVFEIAPTVLPVRLEPVNLRDLPRISEAFITSASRNIVPVVEIDGVRIGGGLPGEKTQALRERYLAWVTEHLEEL
ncbi:MAG: aminotransferase class IV family protein [Anaerolineae bacterium]|nr:aminotransferase class IV family protein [Anaerolineae bacterium]